MRGLFTAGVLDVFLEAGVEFDGMIGVSAGACFGCNCKSRQPGRVIRYNKRFAKDPRYCSLSSLFKSGDLFNAEFCYRELPDSLDPFDRETFEANPMEFHLVTTDCATGKAVYRKIEKADNEAFDWIRASASMPLVSRPVVLDGGLHLDGGLSDGIPLKYFESIGYDRNVVITTRPRGYRKFPSAKIKLLKPLLNKYPAIYQALKARHERYNRTLEYIDSRVAAGAALLIAPPEALPISRVCHDPETMQRVYDIGRASVECALDKVKEFMHG